MKTSILKVVVLSSGSGLLMCHRCVRVCMRMCLYVCVTALLVYFHAGRQIQFPEEQKLHI